LPIKRPKDYSFFFLLFAILTANVIYQMWMAKPIKRIRYDEFWDALQEGKIQEVSLSHEEIRGLMRSGEDDEAKYAVKEGLVSFATYPLPPHQQDPALIPALLDNGVQIVNTPPNKWLGFLGMWVLPIALFVLIYFGFMRANQRMGQEAMSFGRTRAKIYAERDTRTTFEDVAGCEEAKEELVEIIEFLKDPRKFQSLGGKIPKGVLLVGPPGTGKTLLAKAVAGEAEVTFFSISGSEFMEMFVGVGASRVRDMFVQAKHKAPCIVFIDEIDAVGRQRGTGLGGGHDEREQTLNQLLVEMDGFDSQKGVIIMAATNRPDVLDPALLRPGRFDRRIVVHVAGVEGRKRILEVHARGKPLAEDVSLEVMAKRTPGFTGADLANVVNEAALLAARRSKKRIEMKDFEDAIDRVIAGPEQKSRALSEKEKRVVAFHEAGHALVAHLTEHSDPVHKISIIPRGYGALGFTMQLPTEDRYLASRAELTAKITVLLGGRCAEEVIFGEISTGAQNDLEEATELAKRMVCSFGMSEELGPLTYGRRQNAVFLGRDIVDESRNFSEHTAQLIDREVHDLVLSCKAKALALLEERRDQLHALAETLIEREVMEFSEVVPFLA